MDLIQASEAHLKELMTWFATAAACTRWGGPGFRFPYDEASFREDLQWGVFFSFALVKKSGEVVAFGQLFEKYERIHLARLVVHPAHRRKGYGKKLIDTMLDVGPSLIDREAFSLNVYEENRAAISCYLGLGFEIVPSPERDPRFASCLFMVLNPAND